MLPTARQISTITIGTMFQQANAGQLSAGSFLEEPSTIATIAGVSALAVASALGLLLAKKSGTVASLINRYSR